MIAVIAAVVVARTHKNVDVAPTVVPPDESPHEAGGHH
jgi:hypothetical protein